MRVIAWLLLAAFLAIVGWWPPAAAPVHAALEGAAVIVAQVPGWLLLVGGYAVLRGRTT